MPGDRGWREAGGSLRIRMKRSFFPKLSILGSSCLWESTASNSSLHIEILFCAGHCADTSKLRTLIH